MTEYLSLYTKEQKFINIPKNKCIDVELYLNKSKYSKEWIKLGDKLYYFNNPRNDEDKSNIFLITNEQYLFIKNYLQTQ